VTVQRVNLTGHPDSLRYVEVVTDAGIVRVTAGGLASIRDGKPVVSVDVEPVLGAEIRNLRPAGLDIAVAGNRFTPVDFS
jgi:predicted transcriptional regulator